MQRQRNPGTSHAVPDFAQRSHPGHRSSMTLLVKLVALIGFAIMFVWTLVACREEVVITDRTQIISVSDAEAAALGAQAFEEMVNRYPRVGHGTRPPGSRRSPAGSPRPTSSPSLIMTGTSSCFRLRRARLRPAGGQDRAFSRGSSASPAPTISSPPWSATKWRMCSPATARSG